MPPAPPGNRDSVWFQGLGTEQEWWCPHWVSSQGGTAAQSAAAGGVGGGGVGEGREGGINHRCNGCWAESV